MNHYKKETISTLQLNLSVLFVACLLISNILANNMLQIGNFSVDAGTLLFPITYILSDVFSEVYGYKCSRRVTWLACGLNFVMALLIKLSIILPHPEWFNSDYYTQALSVSWRIVIASLISYFIGDLVNDLVFSKMQTSQDSIRYFANRALISSAVGEVVDSTLFITIAFVGIIPNHEVLPMIFINIITKLGYEIIILPITIMITKYVKNKEEI